MLSALLLLWSLAQPILSCWRNEIYDGYPTNTPEITTISLPPGPTLSCSCCAICHGTPSCRSFHYDNNQRRCTFYESVGSLLNFELSSTSRHEFYFMPGVSNTGEFCREDSDCSVAGEFCAGRRCTTNDTWTCLDLKKMRPSLPTRYYWLSAARQELLLECILNGDGGGFTRIVRRHNLPYNAEEARYRYQERAPDGAFWLYRDTSVLRYADLIRDHGNTDTWTVSLYGTQHFSECKVAGLNPCPRQQVRRWHKTCGVVFTVDKNYSLLGTTPRAPTSFTTTGSFSLPAGRRVVFPYFVSDTSGGLVYSLEEGASNFGALLSNDNNRWRYCSAAPTPSYIVIEVREEN